jgi:hypothetical protein
MKLLRLCKVDVFFVINDDDEFRKCYWRKKKLWEIERFYGVFSFCIYLVYDSLLMMIRIELNKLSNFNLVYDSFCIYLVYDSILWIWIYVQMLKDCINGLRFIN